MEPSLLLADWFSEAVCHILMEAFLTAGRTDLWLGSDPVQRLSPAEGTLKGIFWLIQSKAVLKQF